jgi:hypothetical protein
LDSEEDLLAGRVQLEDQQVGGLAPGSIVYLVVGLTLFAACLRKSDGADIAAYIYTFK